MAILKFYIHENKPEKNAKFKITISKDLQVDDFMAQLKVLFEIELLRSMERIENDDKIQIEFIVTEQWKIKEFRKALTNFYFDRTNPQSGN